MPSGKDVYASNNRWLKADNLGDDEATLTITGSGVATFREKDGTEKQQITLAFRETEKELGLNVTNYRVLEGIFKSDETDEWVGNRVVLFVTQTTGPDGREVDCLRIKKKATEKLFQERQEQMRKARPARQSRPHGGPDSTMTGPVRTAQPVTQAEVDAAADDDSDIPF